jgi:N-acetylmuramoyl-L-alanine amidase
MGKIIVLDPGHGLRENGQFGRPLMDCTGNKAIVIKNSMCPHPDDYSPNFYREDFGTLAIAKSIAEKLEICGHKVYLTRTDKYNAKTYISKSSNNEWKKKYWKSWKWIRDFTAKKQADIFVSIHTNAGGGTGTSCFWASSPHGVNLANILTQKINNQLRLRVRRIDKHRYLILRQTCNGRAVLLECLFHDNINDIKLLLTQQGIDKMGEAVASGINNYSLTF